MDNNFKFTVPANLTKSKEGKWVVKGLASAEVVDRQGELIIQKGIDLSPIDSKRGFLNWDHDNSPESTIGILTGYTRVDNKTFIQGELFQKHERAKAIHAIMESLHEHGSGAMGLSIEGKILERDTKNPKIIRKCKVNNVALTLNPVFKDSQVSLVKSFNTAENIVFDTTENIEFDSIKTYTANEVVTIVEKALSISSDVAEQPSGEKSGGDALVQENLDNKPKKKKKLKRLESPISKSLMIDMLDKLQVLYPDTSRTDIWASVKDRLDTKFPQLELKKLNEIKE